MKQLIHETSQGEYYCGDSVSLLEGSLGEELKGKVNLLLTSPPFPLNRKKSYGNRQGENYRVWFTGLAKVFSDLIADDGSIVVELGNSWMPGRPVQSLLPLKSLMSFVENPDAGLRLCQQFVCYNPARLPSPAEWVTIRRIRVTDSYTHIWWMSKTDFPKADNLEVLRPYSRSMKQLLKRQSYNPGERPSERTISQESFLTDHGGSIAHNFFELDQMSEEREVRLPFAFNAFSFSNTNSNDFFLRTCREQDVKPHPARMHPGLAAFFIQFLTNPGDIVLDPFAGSNTTGFVAEFLNRRWVSIDINEDYGRQSIIRFRNPILQETSPEEDPS